MLSKIRSLQAPEFEAMEEVLWPIKRVYFFDSPGINFLIQLHFRINEMKISYKKLMNLDLATLNRYSEHEKLLKFAGSGE